MIVHDQAHVDVGVRIGEGTKVWQFASVIRGAVIGANCTVGSCSVVDAASVGDDCLIGHGAQIHPGTLIGNRVFVGPGAIFCNDMWPSTRKEGFQVGTQWTVIVEDGAVIGAGAVILPGCKIGSDAMVAAGAVCGVSVPVAHIFRRDGTVEPMPADGGIARRMRWAS